MCAAITYLPAQWRLVSVGVDAGGGPPTLYSRPVMTSVQPDAIETDYAGDLAVTGRDFGSAELNAVGGLVLFSSTAAPEYFAAHECFVNESFTRVVCGSPAGGVRGAQLLLRLQVRARMAIRTPACAPH